MKKQEKYNNSGCLDMTAYLALRHIEQKERSKSRRIKGPQAAKRKGKHRP